MSLVTVCIVTWNNEDYIERCLSALNKQTYRDIEYLIIDNKSSDSTVELVKKSEIYSKCTLIENKDNTGFCGGHNLGITIAKGEYYLPLNPDLFLESGFIEKMVEGIEKFSPKVGVVSGKLLRFNPITGKKRILLILRACISKKIEEVWIEEQKRSIMDNLMSQNMFLELLVQHHYIENKC